jgi:hypothetical protein
MHIIKQIKGIISNPPSFLPDNGTTDGALIGNGDILTAIGGESDNLLFWLSKLDFWEANEEPPEKGGARTIGPVEIKIPQLKNASYKLEESIYDATVYGEFKKRNCCLKIKAWQPRTDNYLIIELENAGIKPLNITDTVTIQGMGDKLGLHALNNSTISQGITNGVKWYKRTFDYSELLWPCSVSVAIDAKNKFDLQPGEKITIPIAVVSSFDTRLHTKRAIEQIKNFSLLKLDQLRNDHLTWWDNIWTKCSKIQIDSHFLTKQYYGSLYITASCNGNLNFPPGLFAWITSDYPRWSSDYHTNYNFQAAWWGVLTANLIEITNTYDQAVMDYLPRMKEFAKKYLNITGAYCNVGFGPKGLNIATTTTPYEDGINFLGQKSDASFLALNMILRYYLTEDLEYAEKYAYPFCLEVMKFWEEYLVFENGYYNSYNDVINEINFWHVLPENDREFERAKDKNNPLSLALIQLTSKALIDMSKALGIENKHQNKWQHILDHLPPFPLTERNGKTMFDVCETGLTKLEEVNMCCIQHIFPCGAITLSSPKELIQAGINTIKYKDLWDQNNSFSTIFAAAARIGYPPEIILEKIEEIAKQEVQDNFLFKLGGGGIENNAGIPAGINEMMLQSHEGFIRIFPCWPTGQAASFYNIKAFGAFLVSAQYNGEKIISINIKSEKGKLCRIFPFAEMRKISCRQEEKIIPLDLKNGLIEFKTVPGKSYLITSG